MIMEDGVSQMFVLPVNPEPWKVGPAFKGKVSRDPSLYAYQQAVQEGLKIQNPRMVDGPVTLELFFWHSRVRYQGAKKVVVKNRVDLTNVQKSTEDALQGVVLKNDREVRAIRSYMMEDSEQTEGTVVVIVRPLDVDELAVGIMKEFQQALEQQRAEASAPDEDRNKW